MPRTLNNGYDALVIAFENGTEQESTFFERELNHVFANQRMLYFRNTSMTGMELFQEIWKKMDSHTIFLPSSQRIIICNYIDIDSVSENWLQEFRTFMQEFRTSTGATSQVQHHYLTVFRYRAGTQLKRPTEEIVNILNELWKLDNPMPMQHTEYLLYAGGFNRFDDQEKGIVRLLKTLSVAGWQNVYDITKYQNALHIIGYDEYYEKKALICQQELEKISAWLEKTNDPEFDNLFIKVQECAQNMAKSYSDNLRSFERWLGLYPVSIREFTAHGIGPFKKYERNQMRNSELEAQREEYRNACMKEYQNSESRTELYRFMEENLFYSDYKNIEEACQDFRIEKRIHGIIERCSDNLQTDVKQQFEDMIFGWICDFIKEKLDSLENIKREKEQGRIRYEYEQNLTMKYQNLQACFEGIAEGTVFQAPPAVTARPLMETVYISDVVSNNWALKGYQISGVEDRNVIVDDTIGPLEIQYLRIAKYLELNTDRTLDGFHMVIR